MAQCRLQLDLNNLNNHVFALILDKLFEFVKLLGFWTSYSSFGQVTHVSDKFKSYTKLYPLKFVLHFELDLLTDSY